MTDLLTEEPDFNKFPYNKKEINFQQIEYCLIFNLLGFSVGYKIAGSFEQVYCLEKKVLCFGHDSKI